LIGKEEVLVDSQMLHLHRLILPYLLTFTLDIGLFFALYQYRRYTIFLHACICSLCTITVLVTSLSLLIEYQIPSSGSLQTHAIIGIVVIVSIIAQIACGIISKVLQCTAAYSSNGIFVLNRIHKFNGYFVAILGKVLVYLSLSNAG
jgi:hypothetical protein